MDFSFRLLLETGYDSKLQSGPLTINQTLKTFL